jgi:DHA1 family bicyclomycin/chloramphenicol resistance-like MFS transporter
MLVARFAQGLAGAGTRVIAIAIVRDRFGGRDMARVMSMVMSVFIVVPVVAPGLGGVLVAYGHWQWTFYAIAAMALALIVWAAARLRETLRPDFRRPLRPGVIAAGMAEVARHRFTLGYGTAQGLLLGVLFAYISSSQQIFGEVFGLGELFPIAFGASALGMVVAFMTNARIVGRFGMRLISKTAIMAFIAVSAVQVAIAWFGNASLHVFGPLLAANLFLFGMITPNLNALAMEPHGERAGTASAFLGFYTTLIGAVLGGWIGSFFDGTVLPLVLGYLGLGIAALAAMSISTSTAPPAITTSRQ